MQAACIRQHADGTVHRVAQNLFLSPDKPINELLPFDLGRQDLFRGNVPQAKDWLRAWSACLNPIAFNNAEKHYEAEDFGSGRPCSVTRRGFLVDASVYHVARPCFFSHRLGLNEMVTLMCWVFLFRSLLFRFEPDDSSHALGDPVTKKESIAECAEHFDFSG